MATYEIQLLGGFAVRVDGCPVPASAWRHGRAAEVVKILALADGNRMHRDQMMELLWPGLPPASAAGNVRKAVHFARAVLGADAIGGSGGMLQLSPGIPARIDAHDFEVAARAGRVEALDLYRGELLPEDRYAVWAEQPRERLTGLYVGLLKSACEWRRVLEADPADEEAHRALMRQALESGDRTGAVRQFEQLCQHLRADLGVGPSRESVALYERAVATPGPSGSATAEHVRALLARGLVQLNGGELEAAERNARRALGLAVHVGLGREVGEASALLGIAANQRGEWKERFRDDFTAALGHERSIAAYVLDANICLAENCLHGPNGQREMAQYAAELREVAHRARSEQGLALAELLLGQIELFGGRLEAADRLLAHSAARHQRAGSLSGHVLATHRLAEVAIASGRRAEAMVLLRRGFDLAPRCWLEPHLTVRLHSAMVWAATTAAMATRSVDRADHQLATRNVCQPCSIGLHLAAVHAYARAGRLDQARRRLRAGEQLCGIWPAGPWHAAVWEARGALREAEGDTIRAAALLSEAADQYAELGRPLDRDRCRAHAARNRPT